MLQTGSQHHDHELTPPWTPWSCARAASCESTKALSPYPAGQSTVSVSVSQTADRQRINTVTVPNRSMYMWLAARARCKGPTPHRV
jgi:hypothetical protein